MIKSIIILVLVAAVILGSAVFLTLPQQEVQIHTVTINTTDYSFTTPESINGGLVRFKLVNSGKEDHHGQLFRLNDGLTFQQFQNNVEDFLKAPPKERGTAFLKLFDVATPAGGPLPTSPGKTTEVVQDLTPGQYVLVCFLPSQDGVPHAAKGMIKPLTVTAAVGQPAPPQSQATVELTDFAFNTPDIRAGKTTVQVINNGKEPHEMIMVRLKGISAAELQKILLAPLKPGAPPPRGPPPFEFAGGFQPIAPGERGWTTVDLSAGEYVYVCFISSGPNEGKSHAALGMFKPFAIP